MAKQKKPDDAVAAEFAEAEAVVAAALAARVRGFGRLRAYSPMPVEGLDLALGLRPPSLVRVPLAGFIFGSGFCFWLISYATLTSYRLDVGGRPPFSWPYYVIPSLAIGLLFAALAVFAGFMLACQFPRLNHPAFDIEGIERASADRFFLCIYPQDEYFDAEAVKAFLRDLPLRPIRIQEVRR
jgi:hypothetical protein